MVLTLFQKDCHMDQIIAKEGGLRLKGLTKKSQPGEPLISIVTVVLNNKEYIEETILSVIHQTYSNIEFVVVDGGSTDGTLEYIKKYEGSIDYWISEPDKGIYQAMNKSLKLVSGDYVHFLNSDDHFVDRRIIERIINHFISSKAQLIYGDILMFNKRKGFGWLRHSDVSQLYYLFKGIPQQAFFYDMDLFNKYGNFDESFKIIADLEFLLRVTRKFKIKTKYVKMPVVVFNAGATSSDMETIEKERVSVIETYYSRTTRMLFMNGFFRKQLAKNDLLYPKLSLIEKIVRKST